MDVTAWAVLDGFSGRFRVELEPLSVASPGSVLLLVDGMMVGQVYMRGEELVVWCYYRQWWWYRWSPWWCPGGATERGVFDLRDPESVAAVEEFLVRVGFIGCGGGVIGLATAALKSVLWFRV